MLDVMWAQCANCYCYGKGANYGGQTANNMCEVCVHAPTSRLWLEGSGTASNKLVSRD